MQLCKSEDADDELEYDGAHDGDKHAHEIDVVVQPNIVAHPDAMMVELISASIAPLTVFSILKHVCVAYIAEERVVIWIKLRTCHLVLLGLPHKTLKSHCWVRWVASCCFGRPHYHVREGDQVEDT